MASLSIMRFRRFAFLWACALALSHSTFAAPVAKLKNQPREIWVGDVLSSDDRINYRGYVLQRKNRTVVNPEMALKPIDISYAVLSRKGKRLMKFDANVYFGVGNATRFGLISILGNRTKQAIISQDVYRGGKQWIVTLSRHPRVIFDGRVWSVGREGDDLGLVDLDSDGVYEIKVPTTIFYGFGNLSPAATPLPTIIFKYSKQAGKYLPANPAFAEHLLAGVEKRKEEITMAGDVVDNMNHLSDVMGIVLTYAFAGRQREAWAFYDAAIKLPDRSGIKSDLQKALNGHPVYQYLQRHEKRRRAIFTRTRYRWVGSRFPQQAKSQVIFDRKTGAR